MIGNFKNFDMKNSFLHGDLEEEIYMKILLSFFREAGPNKVCKLKKSTLSTQVIAYDIVWQICKGDGRLGI